MVTARLKMSREMTANRAVPGVRVKPATEANRLYVRHPTGIAFRGTVDDSVEWPNDIFTKRRISDGSVIKVDNVTREAVAKPLEGKRKPKFGPDAG